jgi:hypothetical protein
MAWRTPRIAFTIVAAATACGGSGELRWDEQDVNPDDARSEARELGLLAACNDGTFDESAEPSDTCIERDGIQQWLYPFAECHDGTYVRLDAADDSPCQGRGGFLRAVDTPEQRQSDVALCNDGLFDDQKVLSENCTEHGGIDRFLAEYAECEDGFVVVAAADRTGCENRIARLIPDDFMLGAGPEDVARCNDGYFDDEEDLAENCKKQGGIDRFLANHAECENGRVILLTVDGIRCENSIARLLPFDHQPTPGSDDVAECNDGLFDNEKDLGDNCTKQGGIDRFLATFAECENGRVVLLAVDGITCEGAIARLLPTDYEPAPGPDDVAECNDGLFDNEKDLGENCTKQGGIDRFLAQYAECASGEVIEMSPNGKCEDGITLLPDDYVPPPTTTTTTTTTAPPTQRELLLSAVASSDWGTVLNRTVRDRSLIVTVRSSEGLTDGFTKDSARYAVADVLTRAQGSGGLSEVDQVAVVIRYPLANEFGEVSEENVIEATFTASTIQRIVFDNIDGRDILDLAEIGSVYTHPAIRY